jgi:hypothetical protein
MFGDDRLVVGVFAFSRVFSRDGGGYQNWRWCYMLGSNLRS